MNKTVRNVDSDRSAFLRGSAVNRERKPREPRTCLMDSREARGSGVYGGVSGGGRVG